MSEIAAAMTLPRTADSDTIRVWTGRIMFTMVTLFLLFDLSVKLLMLPMAVEGTVQLGYAASMIAPLGVIQLVCLIAYVIPRTSVIGAVVWTGYLGGAVATHVRLGNPLVTHTLSPVYVAVLLWGALFLRNARVRALFVR